jgi:hypothetical protein
LNSLDSAVVSTVFGLEMPAAAPFATSLFFLLMGTLLVLFVATTRRLIGIFVNTPAGTIGVIICKFLPIFAFVQLAVIFVRSGFEFNPNTQLRLIAMLLGILLGALVSLAVTVIVTTTIKGASLRKTGPGGRALYLSTWWVVPGLVLLVAFLMELATNAFAVLALFALTMGVYMIFKRLKREVRTIVVAAMALMFVLMNWGGGDETTLLPAGAQYKPTAAHQTRAERGAPCTLSPKRAGSEPEPGQESDPAQADASGEGAGMHSAHHAVQALKAWHKRIGGVKNPTVVAVAASGGGYRATFWSAQVLDTIRAEPRLAHFARDLRVLTGASGGMVALAYLAAGVEDGQWPALPLEAQIDADVRAGGQAARRHEEDAGPHAVDSLQPILRSLVLHDLPAQVGLAGAFGWVGKAFGWPEISDRGVALERQWKTLDRRFADLAPGEVEGTRPMLLVAPMISETGEPLVIANGALVANWADGCDAPLQLRELSPSGFSGLKIARAVRANASFPKVSPPLRISFETRDHLTDAGFVDNLGVDLMVRFFSQDSIRSWFKDTGANLVLVQIRAYPTHPTGGSETTKHTGRCHRSDAGPPEQLSRIYFHLTSTTQSLLNARTAGNIERADQQIHLLSKLYPGRVRTVVFENRTNVSMSWYLTAEERLCLAEGMGTEWNKEQLRNLIDALDPGAPPPPQK